MATATKNGKAKTESWSDQDGRKAKSAEHLATVEAVATAMPADAKPIVLPRLDILTIKVRIVGDSSLIVHRWSEKAKKEMLDKQMGIASAGKEKKDPERDYRESAYLLKPAPRDKPFEDGTFGFPTIAFKGAAVEACTSLGKAVTKVAARQAFHMVGELVELEGRPSMREDMVRLNGQTADIRYRAEFLQWACQLVIRYNARVLSAEQVVNLLNTAGFAVGVGEWRSEKDGSHGLFSVAG
jgi:hypothetical protein